MILYSLLLLITPVLGLDTSCSKQGCQKGICVEQHTYYANKINPKVKVFKVSNGMSGVCKEVEPEKFGKYQIGNGPCWRKSAMGSSNCNWGYRCQKDSRKTEKLEIGLCKIAPYSNMQYIKKKLWSFGGYSPQDKHLRPASYEEDNFFDNPQSYHSVLEEKKKRLLQDADKKKKKREKAARKKAKQTAATAAVNAAGGVTAVVKKHKKKHRKQSVSGRENMRKAANLPVAAPKQEWSYSQYSKGNAAAAATTKKKRKKKQQQRSQQNSQKRSKRLVVNSCFMPGSFNIACLNDRNQIVRIMHNLDQDQVKEEKQGLKMQQKVSTLLSEMYPLAKPLLVPSVVELHFDDKQKTEFQEATGWEKRTQKIIPDAREIEKTRNLLSKVNAKAHTKYAIVEKAGDIELSMVEYGHISSQPLKQRIRHLESFVTRMLNILHSFNEAQIVHRDIKPDNIVIFKEDLQRKIGGSLIDFGFCDHVDDLKKDQRVVGTPGFIAPESLGADYHPESDWFAMGISFAQVFETFVPTGLFDTFVPEFDDITKISPLVKYNCVDEHVFPTYLSPKEIEFAKVFYFNFVIPMTQRNWYERKLKSVEDVALLFGTMHDHQDLP